MYKVLKKFFLSDSITDNYMQHKNYLVYFRKTFTIPRLISISTMVARRVAVARIFLFISEVLLCRLIDSTYLFL